MRLLTQVRRIVNRVNRRCAPALATFVLIVVSGQVPASPAEPGSVSGTVTITKRLTRPAIAATFPPYQRGVGAPLAALPKGAASAAGPGATGDWLTEESARVVVWIESSGPTGDSGSYAPPLVMPTIQQVGRRFWPEVVAIPVGGTVSFPNLDPIFHNVFSLSKPKSFDLGNYPMGQSRQVTFQKPGIVYVNCHLHTNMTATIVVVPGSKFTKLGKDGSFSIPEVAPGDYEVVLWHRAIGEVRRKLKIAEGADLRVDFVLPSAEFPKSGPNGGTD